MSHEDRDMSDIVVVLADRPDVKIDDAVTSLKSQGVMVTDIDAENGVVEGTIETAKVKSLQKLPFVEYVRNVFNYVSEQETGDSDQSGDDRDVDDAGA